MSEAPKSKTTAKKPAKKRIAEFRIDAFRDVIAGPTTAQIDKSLRRGKVFKLAAFKKGVKL